MSIVGDPVVTEDLDHLSGENKPEQHTTTHTVGQRYGMCLGQFVVQKVEKVTKRAAVLNLVLTIRRN